MGDLRNKVRADDNVLAVQELPAPGPAAAA
jgi:hypothetical protein